jgi:hypothetical protein
VALGGLDAAVSQGLKCGGGAPVCGLDVLAGGGSDADGDVVGSSLEVLVDGVSEVRGVSDERADEAFGAAVVEVGFGLAGAEEVAAVVSSVR